MSKTARRSAKHPSIPLWLAAHEAAHVVARIQLSAAYHLSDVNRPGCIEEVRVWIEPDGTLRGLCTWDYKQRAVPWPYQAISWAAGPIAEARVREVDPKECLVESDDYLMLNHYAERGYADLDEANTGRDAHRRRVLGRHSEARRLLAAERERGFFSGLQGARSAERSLHLRRGHAA
jgi:hypothetical protein